ncbi:hypothetical protein H0A36_12050 [Endozoicomonas sp. SM1973]|uniref:Uncharacterized protein n=1 Tax=Spartinivicinus marinus TaxID=2994442 RepID=A0A853HZY9_9GAMM|nr:hypothetical protein [Spartinivicinus marinus]MCX4026912.1 hypothetical protein [Spartinivicinus marinus]NYZ66743.1 hypothetical protein [Spartinivicinus marinus]
MAELVYCYDVVTGVINGKAPDNIDYLRFNGEQVVDARNYSEFYIDKNGTKHIVQHEADWQPLICDFNDDLVKDSNGWRTKTEQEKLQEKIEAIKENRRQAYLFEADPLRAECVFDQYMKRDDVDIEAKKQQWAKKIQEIKARYPFPNT